MPVRRVSLQEADPTVHEQEELAVQSLEQSAEGTEQVAVTEGFSHVFPPP